MFTIVNRAFSRRHVDLEDEVRAGAEQLLSSGAVPVEEFDEPGYWGAGATRRTRAQSSGSQTDLTYLRAFCQATRRPTVDGLIAYVEELAVFHTREVSFTPAPWSKIALETADADYLEVGVDLDDGEPEGLFALEIEEFADATALILDNDRHGLLRHLYATRMIATVAVAPSAAKAVQGAAVSLIQGVADAADGVVHIDEAGDEGRKAFILGDRLLKTP